MTEVSFFFAKKQPDFLKLTLYITKMHLLQQEKEWMHMNKQNYSDYQTIHDIYPNKRFKKNGFICEICNKKFKVFSNVHLKTHGITKEEYIEQYGFPSKEYERDYIFKSLLYKLEKLYFMKRNKKLILSSKTGEYSTICGEEYKDDKGKTRYKNNINLYDLQRHLEGKATLGVFSFKYFSKLLVFDVDSYNGLSDAQSVAIEIKKILSKYFSTNQIHIVFSGGKGYHIVLYFKETVSIKLLSRVFSIILSEINIEDYNDVNVEMRPEANGCDGRGVKLPCGVNFRYLDPDMKNINYSCYVDSEFKPIKNEIKYILDIEQSSKNLVNKIIEDYKNEFITDYATESSKTAKKNDSIIEENKDSEADKKQVGNNYKQIVYWINNGLEEHGTRHNVSFKIALYYKALGYSADESYTKLLEWSINQIKTGFTKSSKKEMERDVRHIIYGSVFSLNKDYHLTWYRSNIEFSKSEMYPFIELNEIAKKTGKNMESRKKVLFALMVHGKHYKDINNIFYMTYDQIVRISGVKNTKTISDCITELHELGFIDTILRGKWSKVRNKKLPNQYKITVENSNTLNGKKFKICNKEELCKNCMYQIFSFFYKDDELNKVVTRWIKGRIKSMHMQCTKSDDKY